MMGLIYECQTEGFRVSFFNVTLIIRFTKVYKVYQLISILTINFKNSILNFLTQKYFFLMKIVYFSQNCKLMFFLKKNSNYSTAKPVTDHKKLKSFSKSALSN